jgi:hypothetical protein
MDPRVLGMRLWRASARPPEGAAGRCGSVAWPSAAAAVVGRALSCFAFSFTFDVNVNSSPLVCVLLRLLLLGHLFLGARSSQ